MKEHHKWQLGKIIIYISMILIFIGLFLADRKERRLEQEVIKEYSLINSASAEEMINGRFELINNNNQKVTEKSFSGKYMLVFFGFTNCPSICPTALQNITDALQIIGNRDDVAPIFITVDPDRDNPNKIAAYIKNFHPSLIGLTGTQVQIDEAVKNYRVYAAKTGEHGGHKAEADNYMMAHSGYIYVMDKNGKFINVISGNEKPKDMADHIKKLIMPGDSDQLSK